MSTTLSSLDALVLEAARAVAAEGRSPNPNRCYWRLLDTHSARYQDVKAARCRLLEAGLLPQPAPRLQPAEVTLGSD